MPHHPEAGRRVPLPALHADSPHQLIPADKARADTAGAEDPLMPAKRIYLAGPMTGLPEYNYPAFHAEAARLRALGYHVENPAENPEQDSWEAYMRQAIRQMLTCEIVAFLFGWAESRGALLERYIAQQVGLAVIPSAQIELKESEPCEP
jgi:hypothetical protein